MNEQILIIDDENSILETFSEYLTQKGFAVVATDNVQDAKHELEHNNFDIVISDIIIPHFDGFEILSFVRNLGSNTKVILITGKPNYESARKAIQAGAFDYLAKPITFDLLHKTIHAAIQLKQVEDENIQHREHLEELVKERTGKLKYINSQLRLIAEGSSQLARCKTTEELAHAVLALAGDVMQAHGGSFYFLHGNQLTLIAKLEKKNHTSVTIPLPPRKDSLLEKLYAEKETIAVNNLDRLKQMESPEGYQDNYFLVMPIINASNDIQAIITMYNKTHPPFTKEDLDIARLITTYINELIRNLLLVSAMQVNEKNIRQSEERFRALTENSHDIIFRLDKNLKYLYVNPRISQIVDLDPQEFIGKTFSELDLPKKLVSQWEQLLYQGITKKKTQRLEFQTINGSWFDWLLTPEISSESGDVEAVTISGRDITEKKKAEREQANRLERVERQQSVIVDVTMQKAMAKGNFTEAAKYICECVNRAIDVERVSVWLINKESYTMHCIELYERMRDQHTSGYVLNLSEHPILLGALFEERGLSISDAKNDENTQELVNGYIKPLGIAAMLIHPIFIRGEVVGTLWFEHIGKIREWIFDEQSFIAALAAQLSQVLLNSEREKAEGEKNDLQEQLYQAQKMEAIGRLAGGVAHDFNNILTGILGYAESIASNLHDQDPMFAETKEIVLAAERAASLTNQLLAFSKKQVITPKNINVNQVISNSHKMLTRIMGEDINIHVSLQDDIWNIKIDPTQIDQILVNLVANARDAMPDGGSLHIETANIDVKEDPIQDVLDFKEEEYVLMRVQDEGLGIEPEILNYIFEPFYSTKEKDKGTGLGLATVYGIMEQNEGIIDVHSIPGKGTTFDLFFPRSYGKVDYSAPFIPVTHNMDGKETILIAEDEEMVRRLAKKVLGKRGYKILEAPDGLAALELSREYDGYIDLLLTDVIMPHLNGKDLYEQLHKERPDTKVVYMSGYMGEQIEQHGIISDETVFLQKPFTIETLSQAVRKCLDKKNQ